MAAKYLAFTVSSKNGRSLDDQWQQALRTYAERYGVTPDAIAVRPGTAVPDPQPIIVETSQLIPGNYWYFREPEQERHEPQA